MPTPLEVEDAITALARNDASRVLALLADRFRDLDLADDAVQEGLSRAATTWPHKGIPDRPAAWLMTVARNIAIDRLRRANAERRRLAAAAPHLVDAATAADRGGMAMIDEPPDGIAGTLAADGPEAQLRLMLLCCHPALDRDTQVTLTLRLVGGLSTPEIAAAFLVPEATLAQRIVRAKRKIRAAAIPMSMPEHIDDRLDAVLAVLYLVFNEAYASSSSPSHLRLDLAAEAIRLTQLVAELSPDHAETHGLLAMELFHHARAASRVDHHGDVVLLEAQDRTRWDLPMIGEANAALATALEAMQPGPYQVQALVAAHHANARTADDTDWAAIAGLYAQLDAMTQSAIVRMNRAAAVAMADGAPAGLKLLDSIETLDEHHRFHATRAELLVLAERQDEADAAFARALDLVTSDTERRHIEQRRSASTPPNLNL